MDWQRYRGRVLRYVERQSQITTSQLVDSQADQVRLEELLEGSKPPIGDAQGLDWLMRSPFRYPRCPTAAGSVGGMSAASSTPAKP